jgi:hypothetical protein
VNIALVYCAKFATGLAYWVTSLQIQLSLAFDLRTTQSWGLDGFIKTIREGVTPSDRHLDAAFMPWKQIGHLDDVQLKALYKYIATL